MKYFTTVESPAGTLTLVSDGERITALDFPLWRGKPRTVAAGLEDQPELPVFLRARKWLEDYFAGKEPGELPPLQPEGTPFQRKVWEKLQAIPYGKLTTYGAIAQEIAAETGRSQSAQAVGSAVGRNPIAIFIPCHRVVGSSGSLAGFGGGLDAKVTLLETEGVNMEKLFRPRTGTAL